jgi:NitT/TauT family transport system substrate-binding protein
MSRTYTRRSVARFALGASVIGGFGSSAMIARAAQQTATPAVASPAASPVASGKVTIATGFMPNVQFAPYYLATDRGYFTEAGLEVTLQDGSSPDLMEQLGNGKIDFLITGGDSLTLARGAGIPVTYVMAQFQRYPVGAISIPDQGTMLKTPADLKGKKIGVSQLNGSTYIGLLALLHAGSLMLDDVDVITIGFTEVEALRQRRVDVAMTYITNEPAQVKAMGMAVDVLPVADHVNLVSTGLATASERVANDPVSVQAVVAATLRGLMETLADPDAAFAATLERLPEVKGDKSQEQIQRAVLDATLKFEQAPAGHPLGWSNPEAWQTTVGLLHDIEMLKSTLDPSQLFTNQFAEAANITA